MGQRAAGATPPFRLLFRASAAAPQPSLSIALSDDRSIAVMTLDRHLWWHMEKKNVSGGSHSQELGPMAGERRGDPQVRRYAQLPRSDQQRIRLRKGHEASARFGDRGELGG